VLEAYAARTRTHRRLVARCAPSLLIFSLHISFPLPPFCLAPFYPRISFPAPRYPIQRPRESNARCFIPQLGFALGVLSYLVQQGRAAAAAPRFVAYLIIIINFNYGCWVLPSFPPGVPSPAPARCRPALPPSPPWFCPWAPGPGAVRPLSLPRAPPPSFHWPGAVRPLPKSTSVLS
jgi:hypothetical protein